MSQALLAMMGAGGASPPTYADDVFSSYLYTGNGSTQTITNGIDLAGKGGMVWTKKRSGAYTHYLYDTARGANVSLNSDDSSANDAGANELTAFNATGFGLGTSANINGSAATYVSWTFRKAAKFFDVVTYTGNGDASRVLSHAIGGSVGTIIIKKTSTTSGWMTWHRSLTANHILYMNTTAASVADGFNPSPTDTTFTVQASVGDGCNASGVTYVAYIFAHDTGTDGLIQCGSFTTDGSGNATVNLGWEPQFNLMKSTDLVDQWYMLDSMRGWPVTTASTKILAPNTSGAETTGTFGNPTATGFTVANGGATKTYVYCAVRRPNKPPTTGTQVYNAIARTGTGAAATVTGVGFAPDSVILAARPSGGGYSAAAYWHDRLRGSTNSLTSTSTAAESAVSTSVTSLDMSGMSVGSAGNCNTSAVDYVNHFFKRAPGVFDIVCYTGTGVAHTEAHSLGVAPELIIVKCRSNGAFWAVYHSATGADHYCVLNTTAAKANDTGPWNNTTPTASVFSLGNSWVQLNQASATYVAYLFATKSGISKVGSYTGNGASQTINCGLTTGARFVLIKATSTTGNWAVIDTVRGLIAGSDPYLLLNSTAAEVTSEDCCDPESTGFIVNETTAALNTNAVTYIYLALA